MLNIKTFQSYFSDKKLFLARIKTAKILNIRILSQALLDTGPYVKNHKLVEISQLSEQLKILLPKVVKKNRIDMADLCLPDSYFLTKFISVPLEKIKDNKLKEFINKTAEEVLPSSPDNLYLRYKLLKESDRADILLSSIEKDKLDPIIKPFSKNKILMCQVRPLSSLLSSFINKFEDSPYIMQIYYEGELTTAVCLKKQVLFTTVVVLDKMNISSDVLEKELAKAQHFIKSSIKNGFKFKKIWLIGFHNILKTLKNKYQPQGYKLFLLEEKVNFQDEKKIDSSVLLIAFTAFSFFKNINDFNFIPKVKEKEFNKTIFFSRLSSTLFIFLLSTFFLLAILSYFTLCLFFTLKINESKVKSIRMGKTTDTQKKTEQGAIQVNKKAQILDALYKQKSYSYRVLQSFDNLISAGISVTSFDYNVEAKKIKIKGMAYSRNDLLNFRDRLKKLGGVSIPITNFVKQRDLPFEAAIVLSEQ